MAECKECGKKRGFLEAGSGAVFTVGIFDK
jgi:hypothetical protein